MCGDHRLTTKRFWYFSFAHKLVASIFVYLGEFRLSFKISCPQYLKKCLQHIKHYIFEKCYETTQRHEKC